MKKELNEIFINIKNIPVSEFVTELSITRDMAYKYKNGKSLPSLEKAILIEEKFNIPAFAWVELKKCVVIK